MTARPGRLQRLPAVARARLLEAREGRDGTYLLEGMKHVADALARPGVPVREVWLSDGLPAGEAQALLDAAAGRGVPAGVVSQRDVERASGTVTPQGVLALVLDVAVPAPKALSAARGPVLLLDRVQDPGNVGAIFRSAAGLGAGAVLVSEGSADPMRDKALRASAASVFAVPFARGPLSALLDALATAGFSLWLLDARGDDLYSAADRPPSLALAIGSEGAGPSDALVAASGRRVAIPLAAGVESLNAAVAAGIALAHLARLPATPGAPRPASRPAGRR